MRKRYFAVLVTAAVALLAAVPAAADAAVPAAADGTAASVSCSIWAENPIKVWNTAINAPSVSFRSSVNCSGGVYRIDVSTMLKRNNEPIAGGGGSAYNTSAAVVWTGSSECYNGVGYQGFASATVYPNYGGGFYLPEVASGAVGFNCWG